MTLPAGEKTDWQRLTPDQRAEIEDIVSGARGKASLAEIEEALTTAARKIREYAAANSEGPHRERQRVHRRKGMNAGVYEHLRHPGNYYLFIGLARDHHSDDEFVVYVPLRVEPAWAGTARMALRSVPDFGATFRWVGERLPS